MTPQQRRLIRELVKKYSEHVGTESLIAFVADTNGMLAAGKTLLQGIETGDSSSTDWLFRGCLQYNVVFHSFIEEINRLIAILDPSRDKDDHFTTLGLCPGAGRGEIKQAYRALSLKYHPDTASPKDRDKPEKFIAINKAYHSLLTAQSTEEGDEKSNPSNDWQENRARKYSNGQKKKLFIWASAVLVVLAVVSTIASINIKNRAMLSGLKRGRTVAAVSIRSATNTVPKSTQLEAVPDNGPEPQRAVEQTEQPLQESLTITNNARMPEAQKISFVTESPDRIDTLGTVTKAAKKTLNKKLSVVHVTKKHFKSNSAPTAASIHAPADTPPIQKEPKTVTFPRNVNDKQVVVPGVAIEVLPAKSHETVEKKLVQPDIQSRIDTFLDDYIKAYEQRNFIRFSRFFAADAIENGKPFTSMLAIYSKLFADTSAITLKVEKTSWQQLDGKILFKGSFKVHVHYNDSRTFSGSGPIRFVLMDEKESYRVSILEYDFVVN